MSNNFLVKKGIAVIASGFILGFGITYLLKNNSASERHSQFASQFKPYQIGNRYETNKMKMLTTVRITAPERMPTSADEPVELTGTISLNEKSDHPLFWEWALPEGVSLVEGEMKSFEAHPVPGQAYSSTIKVIGFTPDTNKIIALSGYVDFEESRQGNSATIPSNRKATFESVAPLIRSELDAEKVETNANVRRKVHR